MLRLSKVLLSFLVVCLLPGVLLADEKHTEVVEGPAHYLVYFHADWCGTCKALKPALDTFIEQTSNDSLLIVTLDLSNAKSRQQSAYLASALGMEDLYREHSKKTGFALLVDGSTHDVKARLTAEMKADAMVAAFVEAKKSTD